MAERRGPNTRSNPDVPPESAHDDATGRRPSAMNLGRVGSPRYAGPEPVRINSKKPSAMRLHEIGVRVPVVDADLSDAESELAGEGTATDPNRARRLAGLIGGFGLVFAVAVAAVVFMPRGNSSGSAPAASATAGAREISAPSTPSTAPTPSITASSTTLPTAAPSAATPLASSSAPSASPSSSASHARPTSPTPSARKTPDGLIF